MTHSEKTGQNGAWSTVASSNTDATVAVDDHRHDSWGLYNDDALQISSGVDAIGREQEQGGEQRQPHTAMQQSRRRLAQDGSASLATDDLAAKTADSKPSRRHLDGSISVAATTDGGARGSPSRGILSSITGQAKSKPFAKAKQNYLRRAKATAAAMAAAALAESQSKAHEHDLRFLRMQGSNPSSTSLADRYLGNEHPLSTANTALADDNVKTDKANISARHLRGESNPEQRPVSIAISDIIRHDADETKDRHSLSFIQNHRYRSRTGRLNGSSSNGGGGGGNNYNNSGGGGSSARRKQVWYVLTKLLTSCFPRRAIEKMGITGHGAQKTWREKAATIILFLLPSLLFLLWIQLVPFRYCTEGLPGMTLDMIKNSPMVAVNGYYADIRGTDFQTLIANYLGNDVSTLFPSFMALVRKSNSNSYRDPAISKCVTNPSIADRWLNSVLTQEPGYVIENRNLIKCPSPLPSSTNPSSICFQHTAQRRVLQSRIEGKVMFTRSEISANHGNLSSSSVMVIIYEKVYDVTTYLKYATKLIQTLQGPPQRIVNEGFTMFLPRDVTEELLNNVGQDATEVFAKLPNSHQLLDCFDRLFLRGFVLDNTIVFRSCRTYNPILWATLGIVLGLALLRMGVYEIYTHSPSRKHRFMHPFPSSGLPPACIVAVPVFAETTEMLSRTINSVVRADYDDRRKLLVVICDGDVGADRNPTLPSFIATANSLSAVAAAAASAVKSTEQTVLDLLSHSGGVTGRRLQGREYISVGDGYKCANAARVHSGYYESGTHRVPYIVIAKIGNSAETRLKGNRGKRDSILLMFGFLHAMMSLDSTLLTPLEYELYHQISLLGLDPHEFDRMMVLDGDTMIDPQAIHRLSMALDRNGSNTVAVSGSIDMVNFGTDLAALVQSYALYLSHMVAPMAASFIYQSRAPPINTSLVMYRVSCRSGNSNGDIINGNYNSTTDNGQLYPHANHADVISILSGLYASSPHSRNAFWLGEDQLIHSALLDVFPNSKIAFEPLALGGTLLPSSISASIRQRKQWFISRLHVLIESFETPTVLRPIPLRNVALFLSLSRITLTPIALLYLYLNALVYIFSQRWANFISFQATVAVIAIHLIVFTLTKQLYRAISFVVYISFSLALYEIVVPAIAIFKMDDNRWFDVQSAYGYNNLRDHGLVDSRSSLPAVSSRPGHELLLNVPMKTLAEYEEYDRDSSLLLESHAPSLFQSTERLNTITSIHLDNSHNVNSSEAQLISLHTATVTPAETISTVTLPAFRSDIHSRDSSKLTPAETLYNNDSWIHDSDDHIQQSLVDINPVATTTTTTTTTQPPAVNVMDMSMVGSIMGLADAVASGAIVRGVPVTYANQPDIYSVPASPALNSTSGILYENAENVKNEKKNNAFELFLESIEANTHQGDNGTKIGNSSGNNTGSSNGNNTGVTAISNPFADQNDDDDDDNDNNDNNDNDDYYYSTRFPRGPIGTVPLNDAIARNRTPRQTSRNSSQHRRISASRPSWAQDADIPLAHNPRFSSLIQSGEGSIGVVRSVSTYSEKSRASGSLSVYSMMLSSPNTQFDDASGEQTAPPGIGTERLARTVSMMSSATAESRWSMGVDLDESTKDAIILEIKSLLADADLNQITRRHIHEHLLETVGDIVGYHFEYVDALVAEELIRQCSPPSAN